MTLTDRYPFSKALEDPFYPDRDRDAMAAAFHTAWNARATSAIEAVMSQVRSGGDPRPAEIDAVIATFRRFLSGKSFVRMFENAVGVLVENVFERAGREVDAEAAAVGKSVQAKKAGDLILVVEGMTEADAIAALKDQLVISAGGFFDGQMSDQIKDEMLKWFDNDLKRDDMVEKMEKLVNDRLSAAGQEKLPYSYFERVTNMTIQRVRNIGKYSRGKELGAKGYRLVNPMDNRTSPICRDLVGRKKVYPLESLDAAVTDLLTAESLDELKAKRPMLTDASQYNNDLPPFHFGDCRTTIQNVYI